MNRISFWNKWALVAITICILTAIVMIPGVLGQANDEASVGMDDEGVSFVPMSEQTGLAGSWNLIFDNQEDQYLNLTLSEVDGYLFGPGILALGNISGQATAAGWKEGDHYLLYVVTSDGNKMVKIQLEEEAGLISAGYESYDMDGNRSTGEIHGSRIVEKIGTATSTFVAASDIGKAIGGSKNNDHEDANGHGGSGGDDSSEKTSDKPDDKGTGEADQ